MAIILQKKSTDHHILATAQPIVIKYGTVTQNHPLYTIGC